MVGRVWAGGRYRYHRAMADPLAELLALGPGRAPVAQGRRGVALGAMVVSAGYQVITSTTYDYDGQRRGGSEAALLQYTLAGEGRLRYGDVEHVVRPGTAMVLHWPHDHRYRLPAGGRWEHCYAVVNGRECLRLWRVLERRTGPLLALDRDSEPVRRLAATALAVRRGAFREPYTASGHAYALAMALLAATQDLEPRDAQPVEVRLAMRHAVEHLADDVSVADLAHAAGCSRAHLSRLFRAATGSGPAAWLTGERLNRAAHLLHERDLLIDDIARRCGFRDGAYFARAFRKAFGMSPREYRQAHAT